ncbi:HPr family phosphocarrier protein [Myxococcota bacterium]|nr:HPr family phosphocarrier protein [Myxococcota bacterium]
MVTIQAVIQNSDGIHVRPSAEITGAMAGYDGSVTLVASGMEVELSAMGLLCLGLTCGSAVEIRVQGPDETTVAQKLKALMEKHYDFPRQ